MATLLENAQEAMRLLKIDVLTSLIGNTEDETAQLIWSLANRGGRAIASRIAWQALLATETITTVADDDQGALPSDFVRMIPETMWNVDRQRIVFGPLDAQEWAEVTSNLTTLVNPAFMIRAGHVFMSPDPTAGETVTYTYLSKNWALSSTSTPQASYLADDDSTLFDDEVLILDLIWRYRHNKGLAFDDDRIEFERRLADLISNDGARRTLGPSTPLTGPTKLQIPDTFTALIGL